MKTAFVYLLKGIENDIEEQREKIGTYAKENDIEIIKEFVETDMLAALKHTELQTMIQDLVEKNDIDYVLVHQFDVLTHNMARLGWVITQLEETLNVQTKIHSITEKNEEDNYRLFQSMIHKIGAKEEQIRHTSRLQEGKKEKNKRVDLMVEHRRWDIRLKRVLAHFSSSTMKYRPLNMLLNGEIKD